MEYLRNKILKGSEGKSFSLDIIFPNQPNGKTMLFVHGFKGFKDWGCWDKIGEEFVKEGYLFVKFNFSHNGTTLNSPVDFADLEAFGMNNYSKELYDLDVVINELSGSYQKYLDQLILVGHSRGGGICLIKASSDNRVKAVITWASVPSLAYAWPDKNFISSWKEKGVYFIQNSRTGQEMPLYYQFYEDYIQHKNNYDMHTQCPKLRIPVGIIHGDQDPAVSFEAAYTIDKLCPNSKLYIINGADHVFGSRHPFTEDSLSKHTKELVEASKDFLRTSI